MGRNSCCTKQKLRKGLWSPEEDEKLYNYITRFGVGCWSSVPKLAGLQRCGKSCRLRWINYLRPDLKRGMFSQEEEDLIINLHEALGNRWAQIAAQLPGRTDNEIKNLWNSSLKKKLIKRGIDPSTHKPFINEARIIKDEEKDNDDDLCMINSVSMQSILQQPQGLLNLSSLPTTQLSEHSNGKQVYEYDPLFLPEFQANLDHDSFYQSNFLPHCDDHQDLVIRPSYDHNQNSIPSLRTFDQQNTEYSCGDNASSSSSSSSSSRMMIKYVMMNEAAKQSTSNSNGAMFSWDFDKKIDSVFGFQFSGIQIQERKQIGNQWQEEIHDLKLHTQNTENLITNYPLSQELITETTNMDVFNQI